MSDEVRDRLLKAWRGEIEAGRVYELISRRMPEREGDFVAGDLRIQDAGGIRKAENGKLKEEVGRLQHEQDRHQARAEQLQQQVEILKATKATMGEGEKRALEKRLGQYIREIDRCIALLGE